MDLSGVFAGTFTVLKQRFWLLVLISLLPSLVTLAFAIVIVVLAVGLTVGIVADPRNALALIALLLVVGIAGGLAMALAFVKAQGMTTLAAYEIAQGQHPDFTGLWKRSKGFLPRMAPVIAIMMGAVLVVYGLIIALVISMVGALDGRSGGAAAGVAALFFVLMLALIPIGIFVTTKLLYTVPSIAIEQVGGIDGMKRSWRLTRKAFWRTFGYYIVAALAVGVLSSIVSSILQVPLVGLRTMDRSGDPGQILASLSVAMPFYILGMGVQTALQLVTQPFLYTYVAVMFIDQVRRSELPPAGAYGYGTPSGPQGGYYAAPGQYYGQPGQAYPPQPGAAGPQPGTGYPPVQPPQPGSWQPPTTPQPPQG